MLSPNTRKGGSHPALLLAAREAISHALPSLPAAEAVQVARPDVPFETSSTGSSATPNLLILPHLLLRTEMESRRARSLASGWCRRIRHQPQIGVASN